MAEFQFPNPSDSQKVTNSITGITYIWKENPGKWVIENNSNNSNSDTSALNLPYQLTVGERDSVTGEDTSTFQILETITLKDASGNNLGDVAFESAGGIGVAIDNNFDYPVIQIQGTTIQQKTKFNVGRIYAEELRAGVVPRTYTLVNRSGVPTARPGEFSIDNQRVDNIKAISFGDTSIESLPIGTVSVGDKLCIEYVEQKKKYFYSITSGITNGGIYGVEFLAEDSFVASASLQQNKTFSIEIFSRATPFSSNVDLNDYYSKSEIDEKFTAGLLPGDVDASDYYTKHEVAVAIESFRADLQDKVDLNDDQLQAISTALFNLISDVDGLKDLDLDNAVSALATAQADIIELKSKVNTLELTSFLILE